MIPIALHDQVPPETTQALFEYRLRGAGSRATLRAQIHRTAGDTFPVVLVGGTGRFMIEFREPQRLYFTAEDRSLVLTLTCLAFNKTA
ncbi:MAG: hypothetical protein ACE5HK_06710 [Candidatus Methylomirabilales bacterium]